MDQGVGGYTCDELYRALSRKGGGRKELRALLPDGFPPPPTLPLKEVGTSCCDMIHKNSVSCGFARTF